MKVEVTRVFYDEKGIHRKGDILEVENVDSRLMKPIKTLEAVKPKKTAKAED